MNSNYTNQHYADAQIICASLTEQNRAMKQDIENMKSLIGYLGMRLKQLEQARNDESQCKVIAIEPHKAHRASTGAH